MKKTVKIKYGEKFNILAKYPLALITLLKIAEKSDKDKKTLKENIVVDNEAIEILLNNEVLEEDIEYWFLPKGGIIDFTTREAKTTREELDNSLIIDLDNLDDYVVEAKEQEYFKIVKNFHNLFLSNIHKAGIFTSEVEKAKYKPSLDTLRKMIEIDGVTKEQLRECYLFLSFSDFWRPNVRSMVTLRRKITNIIASSLTDKQYELFKQKRNSDKQQGTPNNDGAGYASNAKAYVNKTFENIGKVFGGFR